MRVEQLGAWSSAASAQENTSFLELVSSRPVSLGPVSLGPGGTSVIRARWMNRIVATSLWIASDTRSVIVVAPVSLPVLLLLLLVLVLLHVCRILGSYPGSLPSCSGKYRSDATHPHTTMFMPWHGHRPHEHSWHNRTMPRGSCLKVQDHAALYTAVAYVPF